jgi:DNA-binding Xre family transcriptional regulator
MKIYAKNTFFTVMANKFITTEDLVNGIKMSKPAIHNIIKRKTGTTIKTAKKICNFLSVEFSEIFEIVE